MPKYAIAFLAPAEKSPLRHKVVDGADRDTALRTFFNDEAAEFYSDDEQGFFYFRDDFFDHTNPGGSIIEC